MVDCKSEFIVQRGNIGRVPEWHDLVNNTYRSRDMAIQRMEAMKESRGIYEVRYRVIHRITTEVAYEGAVGIAPRWIDDEYR